MTDYKIVIDDLVFENPAITVGSIKIPTSVDLSGAELASDEFMAEVDWEDGATLLFSPSDYDGIITADDQWFGCQVLTGDISTTPYGTPLFFYKDGGLFGKFFVRNIVRIAKTKYKITAMSAVGFLENQRHMGGLYQNVNAGQVLDEIIGNMFEYTVDPAVAGQSVLGWLPIGTRRDNLHQLMYALGFSLTKDENGEIYFSYLRDGDGEMITDDRIFVGGAINYQAPATAVEVVEHSYYALATDPEEQLFDNTGSYAASNQLVEFSEPYHDLVASAGLTIDSYDVNYAYVSGVGTLTGKKYTHNTRTNTHYLRSNVPNVVTSEECTLVNALNSESVAQRLLAYYGGRKTVKADIKIVNEKSGDLIKFNDAFGELSKGYITQMETVASSFLRAACQIVTNYIPTGQGNYYSNRVLVAASGTWQVPVGVNRIRIVLIGGGEGGSGGYDGEDGQGYESMQIMSSTYRGWRIQYWQYKVNDGVVEQHEAVGGNAGEAGLPGKLFSADYDVFEGDMLTFTIGAGGAGGLGNGGVGSDGTATSVSSTSVNATSADGVIPQGYSDPITGDLYATPGESGHAGANGGMTDVNSLSAFQGFDGYPGHDLDEWNGGAGGAGFQWNDEDSGTKELASGGGGGGAAYGANGGDGGTRTTQSNIFYGGAGGAGADALAPSAPTYGCGGGAGNGGGGGGNAAAAYVYYNENQYTIFAQPGVAGIGGKGSAGGQGGAGCAIIYY